MLKAAYARYILKFKEPATTSRETMTTKETYFVKLWHAERPEVYGIGESALFRGLSADDTPDYEPRLASLCARINEQGETGPISASSMRFGIETALADLHHGGTRHPYPTAWSRGEGDIQINGLVWMGTIRQMLSRVEQKLSQGFRCVKFKIGGQEFDQEVELLRRVRSTFSEQELEIRLDANGAFDPEEALQRLDTLSEIGIHSIEQPIKPRQWPEMARLCRLSPIPIALDEELIGIESAEGKQAMLSAVSPQYIILKPSLCGGISGAKQWIDIAEGTGVGWWVTSALESNIGLNALAQWVSTLGVEMPQGLGTGALYTNNIESPLRQIGSGLVYDANAGWSIPEMTWR